MQILIVALLSKEVEVEVRRISSKYHPQLYAGKELPPHITLIPPVDLVGELANIERSIELVMNSQPDFTITIQSIGSFSRRNNVVYLKVEPSAQFENIQEEVVKSLSSLIQTDSLTKSPFHPHITLAKKMDTDRLDQILGELKNYYPKFVFPFQSIALYTLDKREMFWRLKKIFS